MDQQIKEKVAALKDLLKGMSSALIAFSGGKDSTFLLNIAQEVLRGKIAAATALSPIHSSSEREEARKIAAELGVKHLLIPTEELSSERFTSNPYERCYFCKQELFSKLREAAKEHHLRYLLDGSTSDDLHDFRPGRKAAIEFGVRSPLEIIGFSKEEICKASKALGLPTWNKPPSPCLATRIPYGNKITLEKLQRIEESERFLRSLGASQVRVRDHDGIARIEIEKSSISLFLDEGSREEISKELKNLGFHYITLDLEGYRYGSMNPSMLY